MCNRHEMGEDRTVEKGHRLMALTTSHHSASRMEQRVRANHRCIHQARRGARQALQHKQGKKQQRCALPMVNTSKAEQALRHMPRR